VIGSMFAPVLVNENAINWGTNLIGIDAAGSYGSPSYWIEKLFADYTGKQVLSSNVSGTGGLKEVVSKTTEGGRTTFYVKVVNYSNQQQSARLNFTGVSRLDEGDMTTLTGDPNVRNTLANPTAIAPGATKPLTNLSLNPRFTFPGSSVTVIKLVGALGEPGVPPTSVTPDPVDLGGSVPPTLALTVNGAPEFGAFTPGVTKDYEASTTATVTSSAGDAALTVSDPGHLMNGTFALPEPLQVAVAPASWTGPVANAAVTIAFKQRVNATDPLRTGRYSKTLTFTLSTTKP
jgi:hypothetical protein